jgi:T-complex protein 1 subunit zeta
LVSHPHLQCRQLHRVSHYNFTDIALIAFRLDSVVPDGGAFEIVAHHAFIQYLEQVKGRARLGVQAFAEALLIIPKASAQNAGHDQQETIVELQQEYTTSKSPVGISIPTGKYFFN